MDLPIDAKKWVAGPCRGAKVGSNYHKKLGRSGLHWWIFSEQVLLKI
jgi:hypothetical protein